MDNEVGGMAEQPAKVSPQKSGFVGGGEAEATATGRRTCLVVGRAAGAGGGGRGDGSGGASLGDGAGVGTVAG